MKSNSARIDFRHFLVLIPIIIFLAIRLMNNGIYAADSGYFFYLGKQILQHNLLYKDIFFADLPLLPYISAAYFVISGGSFLIFNFLAAFETVTISVIIYYLLYRKSNNLGVSTLGVALFLFSPITLIISNNQTFVLTATLFSILGYLCIEHKKFVFSGLFLGLSFLMKAYLVPIVIAFIIAAYIKYGFKAAFKIFSFYVLTTILCILPFIFLAGKEMWSDIVHFSLLSGGRFIPLTDLVWFFISHELLLSFFLVLSVIYIKKDYFIGISSLSFILLFIVYQGMKPYYVLMVIPLLCLYTNNVVKIVSSWNLSRVILPIIVVYLCYTFIAFGIVEAHDGRISNVGDLIERINKENPRYIYGATDVTPILSYLTNIPILDGQVNTDAKLFNTGVLNRRNLTQDALNNRTLFLILGTVDNNTGETLTDTTMLDIEVLKSNSKCRFVYQHPLEGKVLINKIFLFKCY